MGTGTPGFGVKITPAGRKIFIVLYRTAGADHRAYGRVPQRVIAHRLRAVHEQECVRPQEARSQNQRIPQRSNMLVLRGRAFGSRIQWLLSACLHAGTNSSWAR